MTDGTVKDVINFILDIAPPPPPPPPPLLQITGGEFTEHPDFENLCTNIIKAAHSIGTGVTLHSNGLFISNDRITDGVTRLLRFPAVIHMQIRTHPKYYPSYEKVMTSRRVLESLPKVQVFDDAINLVALGKAAVNFPDIPKLKPSCSNVFGIVNQGAVNSLSELIKFLQLRAGKYCKPLIDIDGSLRAGESIFCQKIGSVTDYFLSNIRSTKPCNRCGSCEALSSSERLVVGLEA